MMSGSSTAKLEISTPASRYTCLISSFSAINCRRLSYLIPSNSPYSNPMARKLAHLSSCLSSWAVDSVASGTFLYSITHRPHIIRVNVFRYAVSRCGYIAIRGIHLVKHFSDIFPYIVRRPNGEKINVHITEVGKHCSMGQLLPTFPTSVDPNMRVSSPSWGSKCSWRARPVF
jgi:hypothetical protein